MKKPTIITLVAILLVIVVGFIFFTKKSSNKPATTVEETKVDLPINTIPVAERPFITLSPDSTGRSLNISLSGAPSEGSMEYEMIYNASGKQEGALGSIYLGTEKQPITKSILLGSKSGGGKITYHEGVTGGSITLTYGETRLKESWNYLHFDQGDPSFSTTDGKLSVTLNKTALKKDSVIITMKTFGYPKIEGKVVAGPYGYFTQTPIKGSAMVELKLPAGEHVNPTIYEWNGTSWKKLATKLVGDTVSATSSSSLPAQAGVFVVTTE
jgi:hypothetical protein